MVERVAGHQIDVGFEKAVLADDVEMAAVATDDFRGDDLGGRQVEIRFGKCFDEAGDVGGFDFEDEIDVVGEARFAVGHGGDGAGDRVGKAGGDQRPDEGVDELNHEGEGSGGWFPR